MTKTCACKDLCFKPAPYDQYIACTRCATGGGGLVEYKVVRQSQYKVERFLVPQVVEPFRECTFHSDQKYQVERSLVPQVGPGAGNPIRLRHI